MVNVLNIRLRMPTFTKCMHCVYRFPLLTIFLSTSYKRKLFLFIEAEK